MNIRTTVGSMILLATAFISGAAQTEEYKGAPRTFLWNQGSLEIFDAAKFKKAGPYTIGFSNASISNPWRVAFVHSIENAAAKNKDKIKRFIITDANDSPTKQIADMQDLMQQGVDILLVSPATAEALDPIAGQAMKKGIPVVMSDRRTTTESNFVTFVTISDRTIGRIYAQWLVERLGGKGGIVMLGGMAGASPAELRIAGAKEVFAQYPDIKILDLQYTSWSLANGKKIMSALIKKFGDRIDAVWADSGIQGQGSVEAFLAAGYQAGKIPPHTGGDFNGIYKIAVKNKVPMVAIDYPASMGGDSVLVLFDVLAGKAIPKRLEVNSQVVVSRGDETKSVKADVYAENYAVMNRADDMIVSVGIGPTYDPRTFKADYPR